LKQNNYLALPEKRARRLVNVNVELNENRHDDNDHVAAAAAAAAADVGILSTGGTATYNAESAPVEQNWRELQEETMVIGPDTPVKNSTLTLGEFPYEALSYFSTSSIEYICSLSQPGCACVNNTDGTTTITCVGNDYCSDFTSRCGENNTDCFDAQNLFTVEDNANFIFTFCVNYSLPYEQSTCVTQVTEENLVTSCSGSWNGVDCQKCQVEPTLGLYDPVGDSVCFEFDNCTEVVDWCFHLDCTSTDLGLTLNTCYWLQYSPIYNNALVSAGCEEACEICPEGSGDGTADIETFAANGTYSCPDIIDLGSNGYFSVDECAALQSYLPEVCGCTGSSAGETTDSSVGDGSGADSPSEPKAGAGAGIEPDGGTPSGSISMYHRGTLSLVVTCVMMVGAMTSSRTDAVTVSV
jgi:hypothetical protein